MQRFVVEYEHKLVHENTNGTPSDSAEFELLAVRADGHTFPLPVRLSRISIDDRELYTAIVSDISERRCLLDRLTTMAEHDATTGLHNRAYFQAKLMETLASSTVSAGTSLAYLDLDNFKHVNHVFGHAAGDALLVEVAELLQRQLPEEAVVARFGGDEFTVQMANTSVTTALERTEILRANFERYTFRRDGKQVDIGCSIGVAAFDPTDQDDDADRLMARADTAYHLAKRAGHNRVRLFEAADQTDMATMALDMGWSKRIRQAIATNGFVLTEQPIVAVDDRTVDCYEIIVRLRDESGELIMPNAFLPTAGRLGLANAIYRWIIQHAIDLLVERRAGNAQTRFVLKLSAQSLGHNGMGDFIAELLCAAALEPAALTFKITESDADAIMDGAEAVLRSLRDIGCRTALDEFGSGRGSVHLAS